MRHAVLGAGGVGVLVAGAMARANFPVTLILRPDSLGGHPRSLSIQSAVLGQFEAEVSLTSELRSSIDVLWIAVKATHLNSALAAVRGDTIGSAVVVPLLNGVGHMEVLRRTYGAQVIAATIRVESERLSPGRIRQPSPFAEIQLAAQPELLERARDIGGDVRRAGLGGEVEDDEVSLLWRKFVFLAPLALSTTASARNLGAVREDERWRERLEGCLAEVCAIAEREGARIDQQATRQMLLSAPGQLKSSMQKDVEAGREPEIDAIGGEVLRRGQVVRIPTPVTEELVEMVKAKAGISP